MRYWILPVALCACVSPTGPVATPDSGLVTTFPGPHPPTSPTLDPWFAVNEKAPAPRAKSGPRVAGEPPVVAVAESGSWTREDASSERAARILQQPELAAYHGWIRYLHLRAVRASERHAGSPGAVMEDRLKLAHWTQKILDDPNVLGELRGITEWAYTSPVDGSGQPFKLNVPTDYDPARPAALLVRLHGEGGNHLEGASDMQEHAGYFELSVLGRARDGEYRALSEADVLQALDYVAEHWAIDPRRVHLVGGGPGNAGALWLASRHPERFASSELACASSSDGPPDARITVPVCELQASATGAASGYDERARPASHEVERLDFTAMDGKAVRAFWAEIAEWGSEPRPAHFAIEVASNNRLKARLDNVRSLRLRLAESPVDPQRALRLDIKGGRTLTLPAPLPEEIWLEREGRAWSLSHVAPVAPFRLHTPGGANQLYDGAPLLIAYGTGGNEVTQAALRAAAEAASRSSNASWPKPGPRSGGDGVPDNQLLYGELEVKADADVTAYDLTHRHLVLIGTADQNSVVARLAHRLPVSYRDATIQWNDGTRLSADDRALGLVHYNPEAPNHLIFWVASDDPAAYAAGSLAPELLGASVSGADAVVVRVSDPALVQSRSFDSRWHWLPRDDSPLLPAELASSDELDRAVATAVRRMAPADFAIAGLPEATRPNAYEPGEARLSDVLAQHYFAPIGVMTLRGSDLVQAAQAIAPSGGTLVPETALENVEPTTEYRLALSERQLSAFVRLTRLSTNEYRSVHRDVAQALGRHGVAGARAAPKLAGGSRPRAVAAR